MATVAELAAQEYQEVAYLFVIEGWRAAFTNRVELAGEGEGSWIGDSEDRVVALGLEPPAVVKLAVDLLDSGMPIDDSLTLTIIDRDELLIEFAEDEVGDLAYGRLAPTDDPAPATVLGPGGTSIDLHGRWIDGEAIGDGVNYGTAGQRRMWQILPGVTLPGLDHPAIDTDAGRPGLRTSTVCDAARWLEGRPCALFLIRKDLAAGTWPDWQTQYESGVSLIWFGTLRGARAESHAWTIDCEGPSSWLRRTLNAARPDEWRLLSPILELAPGQDRIAASFFYRDAAGGLPVRCGTSAFTSPDDELTSGQTPADLAFEIHTRLQTIAGTAGLDATFSTYQNGEVELTDEHFKIRVDDNNGGTAEGGVCLLRMHQLVWLHLGWDLTIGIQGWQSLNDLGSEYEVKADHGSKFVAPDFEAADPTTGYWTAVFTTWPLGIGDGSENPWRVDGDGAPRIYLPVYPGGGVALLYPEAGQTWDVGFGTDAPYLERQLARPAADVELHGDACDAAAFFVVRGSYRKSNADDAEVETHTQLAVVSWVDDDDRVAVDSDSRAVVWAEKWLDPKQWGAKNGKIAGVWAANDLEYVPIALLSYNLDGPDHAHRVLARLLLSTGTASWSGVGEGATITAGGNAHPDAGGGPADDLEIADLGLGIPAAMIDLLSLRAAAEALPGGIEGPLNKTRLAYIGPFDSQQTIEDIIRPRGWCFSLRGGRYGLFARSEPLDIGDVEVAITEADIAADPDTLPPVDPVDLRPLEPIDLIEVSYGASQLGGDGDERTVQIKARDPRAAQRRGNARVEIGGRSLTADGAWLKDFTDLWGDRLARYFGEPRALVRVSVKGHVARDIWPGTIVTYTSPWPATRSGSYGMTSRVGRVVSVERDTLTLAARLEILVEGGDPSALRRFAPIAVLVNDHTTVEGRHDAVNCKLYCQADAFGRGDGVSDVAAFAEPAWSTSGGQLGVYAWSSWDGVEWEQTAYFQVASVNTTENSITYDDGAGLEGEIFERRFTVLMPAPTTITAWALALLGRICGSDGLFGAGNTPGYPWVE